MQRGRTCSDPGMNIDLNFQKHGRVMCADLRKSSAQSACTLLDNNHLFVGAFRTTGPRMAHQISCSFMTMKGFST
jgi:hypothetical protein